MKLYHKLELENVDSVGQVECCKQSLDDRDEDIELRDTCFSKASDLTEAQRASLYYICGYVTFKEDINSSECDIYDVVESEFTNMVSRGRLKHPIHHRNCLICHSICTVFLKIEKGNVVHEYFLKHSNIFTTRQNMNSKILTRLYADLAIVFLKCSLRKNQMKYKLIRLQKVYESEGNLTHENHA